MSFSQILSRTNFQRALDITGESGYIITENFKSSQILFSSLNLKYQVPPFETLQQL